MVPIAVLLANFDSGGALSGHMTLLVIGGLIYIAVMSFFVSAVCGYMAGLIGSSNSPLSGHRHPGSDRRRAAAGIRRTLGSAGRARACPGRIRAVRDRRSYSPSRRIANNNLQDLKTGQLVDATPWKQQVALSSASLPAP